ncbi:type VI secretion system membrane subunit TssM [Marinobacter halophilus]|uniref:Type VI secretion system membrane subunit TssM n=1 Tax=Marinobacter halophilus TaxID=1323740 RepID=A0A2T1KIX2_9GAMM|nr:type VI secretion system membrane subunit TssM [Marinobacter halophilus]PSF09663.1 type VI secretion system membrane subunit TssM [Marinobacter halophilus]GGC65216.1 type VI secretion protein IcmF [Marinobacter halophilus]
METMWRKALLIGRWLLPHLRNAAPVTLTLAIIALLVATWWLGPRLEIAGEYPLVAWQMRALVTLGVVLLVVVFWGMALARRLGKVNKAKAEEQQEQEDPILPMERRQQRLLDRQLQALKSNLPGRKGLYRLPWYLVMGLEGAGKTSLIQRAGQTYTLTNVTRNNRGDRNPFGFDWWIGDNGVLIDPDGELLSQGEGATGEIQNRLWNHFIGWLERSRPQRPLNGVILAVDLARLSTSSDQQREAHAILLRTRLRELMEQLGSRLPVYITFTKMDLMYGFAPFVRSLSKAEKDQALGFTFRLDSQQDHDQWLEQFADRYTEMVDELGQRLPDVLADNRDSEDRAAAYSFTRQLAGLKPTMEQFLTDLLSADAFSTPALVRGTYFTSVLQEGVPEDAFVAAAARNYQMTGPIQPAQRGGQSASLFTKGLFPDVIYPEAGLAGDNRKVVGQRQRKVAVAAVVALFAGAGITAGWQHYFVQNAEAATQVENRVKSFLNNWQPVGYEPDSTGRNLLQPLDELREATLAFGDYRNEWSLVADMGLYQGHKVGPEVDAAYVDMLAYQYLPALMFGVMEDMGRAPDNSTERLEHLRVLRMMYDAGGRRTDIVASYMRDYWQSRFPGQRDVQNRLYGHLQYAMAHTNLAGMAADGDQTATMALAPFRSSVQWAQHELGRISTPDRVYRDLQAEANRDFQTPLELARSSGPAFTTVFNRMDAYGEPLPEELPSAEDPLSIPALLTRDGLEKWFLRKSGSVTELALVDAWVLGRRNDVDFSKADEAELLASLQTLYAEHYASAWRTAVSRVNINRFEDLNHGVRILESLTSGHEPLARLLDQVQANTRLIPVGEGEAEATRRLLEQSPHFRMLQDIERQFADLNRLTRKQGDQPSGLDEIMLMVGELHEYLRNIQESPDAGKAALSAARARMGLQGADPIFTLQRMSSHQPEPLNRVLNRLASESWRVVLDRAVAQLEREWYREVYQPFQQNLARHYPFTAGAGRDAALQDFERFFAPDGILETFYNDNLKLFLEDHPEHVGDARRASLVRRDVVASLERAKQIRQAFFTRSGALDVEFALEPLNLTNNKRRAVVNIDGQLVEFSHGPRQSIPLVWPNTLRDSAESRITLVPIQVNRSPRSISESGPWALFRLLDKADIAGVSGSAVDVKFNVDDGEMRYRLHAASNTNPFTQQLLSGYRIPRSLY